MRSSVLAFTDDVVLPMSALEDAVRELGDGAVEHVDYQVMTQASTSSKMLLESSSVDAVVSISRTHEFPGDFLFGEVLRVLKPGGTNHGLQDSSIRLMGDGEGWTIKIPFTRIAVSTIYNCRAFAMVELVALPLMKLIQL